MVRGKVPVVLRLTKAWVIASEAVVPAAFFGPVSMVLSAA